MITLKTLKWDNCFSYGKDNSINLNNSTLTQLVGTNGMGKSSIPLIIEEVLYNKNSKGIKKADIQNRFINAGYNIHLTFAVEDKQYSIDVSRSRGSIKVKLFEGAEDISSHTATNTYKSVEQILGLDFKTFTQLVYQNTNASLQFLTATDANRKKFLIELLNLEDYVAYYDVFRELARTSGQEVAELDGKSKTIIKWLDENKLSDSTILPMIKLPEYSEKDEKALRDLSVDFENISEKNQKINENNTYKQLLGGIDMGVVQSHTKAPEPYYTLVSDRGEVEGKMKSLRSKIQEYQKLEGQCPTCEQEVDHNFIDQLIVDLRTKLLMSNEDLREFTEEIDKRKDDEVAYNNYKKEKKEFEDLYSRVDRSLPTEIYNGNDLQEKIATLKKSITHAKSQIQEIATQNEERTKKNTRVQVILEQTAEFEKELEGITDKLSKVEEKAGHIEAVSYTHLTLPTTPYV